MTDHSTPAKPATSRFAPLSRLFGKSANSAGGPVTGLPTEPRNWRSISKWSSLGVALVLLGIGAVGFWYDHAPDSFDVRTNAEVMAKAAGIKPQIVGVTTVTTSLRLIDDLVDKPGGYLSNDLAPPFLWMDNVPAFEQGVLQQLRDVTQLMRKEFSRAQSQDQDDPDLAIAVPKLNVDPQSYLFPAAESEYREGRAALQKYLLRLADEKVEDGQFYARADNLVLWLREVETRLGSTSQALANARPGYRVDTGLALDPAAQQSTPTRAETRRATPWLKIDDRFYEARGTCYALLHLLRAVEVDFASVLEDKNARATMRQIIRELEATQEPLRAPVIVNGSGFGLFANHSLVLASYVTRANASVANLRAVLEKG
jgi:hypothetical protein